MTRDLKFKMEISNRIQENTRQQIVMFSKILIYADFKFFFIIYTQSAIIIIIITISVCDEGNMV